MTGKMSSSGLKFLWINWDVLKKRGQTYTFDKSTFYIIFKIDFPNFLSFFRLTQIILPVWVAVDTIKTKLAESIAILEPYFAVHNPIVVICLSNIS